MKWVQPELYELQSRHVMRDGRGMDGRTETNIPIPTNSLCFCLRINGELRLQWVYRVGVNSILELELELKLVELKMELELKTLELELELKTGIEFFATATAAITSEQTISIF